MRVPSFLCARVYVCALVCGCVRVRVHVNVGRACLFACACPNPEVRPLLWSWYSDQRRRGVEVTALQNLTVSMIGTNRSDSVNMHGAEVNYIVQFSVEVLLRDFEGQLGDNGRWHRRAGEALMTMLQLIRQHHVLFDAAAARQFNAAVKQHLHAALQLQIGLRPKHHQMMHMSALTLSRGSPALWGCWHEEGMNRWLARVAQRAHRNRWTSRVLAEMKSSFGVGKKRRIQ